MPSSAWRQVTEGAGNAPAPFAAGDKPMLAAFEAALASRGYVADPAQRAAARRLQRLYDDLIDFKTARRTRLHKLLSRATPPQGMYFWGGVGRGKSFLMDCFFDAVPYRRKRRVHFHAFMQEVHEQLKHLKHQEDPLRLVADEIARATRLLCFDEFHVSDIADAMMLGRLVDALFERGVVLVATSNYPPDGLYPNGLQRQNFLPTIELLKRKLDVFELDNGTDYRLRTLEQLQIYLVPVNADNEARLAQDFAAIAGEQGETTPIRILERDIPVRRRALGVIWFDFADLCGGPRSQNDYLELAREHHTLLLSGVPVLSRERANEARRLTWLVDVLYDFRVKLILCAEAEAHALYTEGPHASEFVRTVSRLTEMRTREYLGEAHRVSLS